MEETGAYPAGFGEDIVGEQGLKGASGHVGSGEDVVAHIAIQTIDEFARGRTQFGSDLAPLVDMVGTWEEGAL